MARFLLDSNAFLRSKETPQALRRQALETIEDTSNELFVSLASIWELAIKASEGKLRYFASVMAHGPDAVMASLEASSFLLLPVEPRHALASVALPLHHKDPFDRVMIAQALAENMVLITSDRKFVRYSGLRILAA
jgi:PIN domain nuclease of toxin-antitoxin system